MKIKTIEDIYIIYRNSYGNGDLYKMTLSVFIVDLLKLEDYVSFIIDDNGNIILSRSSIMNNANTKRDIKYNKYNKIFKGRSYSASIKSEKDISGNYKIIDYSDDFIEFEKI